MHSSKKAFMLALFVAAACTSCQTVMTGIVPSTTPIAANDTYATLGPTKGKAYGVSVLGIPMSDPNPSLRARNRAINLSGGNALIEVTEDFTRLDLLLVTVFTTRIRGTAVQVERGGADR